MCRFGLKILTKDGEMYAKKPTSILTNSPSIHQALHMMFCDKSHAHVKLECGLPRYAAKYTPQFCDAVLRGLVRELSGRGPAVPTQKKDPEHRLRIPGYKNWSLGLKSRPTAVETMKLQWVSEVLQADVTRVVEFSGLSLAEWSTTGVVSFLEIYDGHGGLSKALVREGAGKVARGIDCCRISYGSPWDLTLPRSRSKLAWLLRCVLWPRAIHISTPCAKRRFACRMRWLSLRRS